MRKLIIYLCFAATFANISAKQISEAQALDKAQLFGKNATSTHLMSKARTSAIMSIAYRAMEKESDSVNYFYVFNRGTEDGYVIVSADDKSNEILGYCDQGSFDYSSLPDNMKSWLDGYREEIKYLRTLTKSVSAKLKTDNETSIISTSVTPLLGRIAWNQDAPYNNLCPLYMPNTRSSTGCVATAMAQILYYHRWPEKGNGTHTYSPSILSGNVLTANFGETTYDWNLINPFYNSASSDASKLAVATLMLQCGIAVDMEYSSASGALSKDWCYALENYFNYDPGVSFKNRDNYGTKEWDEIIRTELDNARPVFVTGFATSGGHAFVCDGYSTDGFFHINWGWGGMSNGYFLTTALTPSTQGLGGSDGGFNYKQAIITGIQKPQSNSIKTIELISTETLKATPSTITKSDKTTIKLTGKVQNMGWEPVVCDFGIAAFDANESQVFELSGNQYIRIEESAMVYGSSFLDVDFSSLADGTYTLRPMCRVSGTSTWQSIHESNLGYVNYLIMIVENNTIKFTSPNSYTLSATNITISPKIYAYTSTAISAEIKNTGTTEYYGDLRVTLYNKSTNKKVLDGENRIVDLTGGSTTTVNFVDAFNVPAGDYLLSITDQDYSKLSELIPVTIMSTPTQKAIISITENVSFTDNEHVPSNDLKLKAKIHCAQGVFSGYIYAYIYPENGTTVVGSLDPTFVTVEAGSTVDMTLSGNFETGINGGRYLVNLVNGTNNAYITPVEFAKCYFTIFNPMTGVAYHTADDIHCVLSPNPANSSVNIKSSFPIKMISIYAINGIVVMDKKNNDTSNVTVDISALTPGQYIISVNGEHSKTTKLLIKNNYSL